MSQTFFAKLNADEKIVKLFQLSSSNGLLTLWAKGSKDKQLLRSSSFDKIKNELIVEGMQSPIPSGSELLCSFELKGNNFFSQVVLQQTTEKMVIKFPNDLFKSERRGTYRLFTSHSYQIWAQLDLGQEYQGGNVIDLNTKTTQTGIFKSFLKMAEGKEEEEDQKLSSVKIKVQDISVSGLALHVSQLELPFFQKDKMFIDVGIFFNEDKIVIPKVKIVYVVESVSANKKTKIFKIGCHFEELPEAIDHALGRKINSLLRENDSNREFENFLK
jgi:hypothetical protein